MAHQVDLTILLRFPLPASFAASSGFLLLTLLLCKHNAEINTLVHKCRFDVLQSVINFRDSIHLILGEQLRVEEWQVQVFDLGSHTVVVSQGLVEPFRHDIKKQFKLVSLDLEISAVNGIDELNFGNVAVA